MNKVAISGLWSELRGKVDAHYGRPTLAPEPHLNEAILEKWLAEEGVTIHKGFQSAKFDKKDKLLKTLQSVDGREAVK